MVHVHVCSGSFANGYVWSGIQTSPGGMWMKQAVLCAVWYVMECIVVGG